MKVVIRVVLMFFFIQFVVVMTIMVLALLLARPEVPALSRGTGNAWRRSFAFVIHLPKRILRSVARLMHHMHLLGSVH
ncbi:MAG: hypothetical protein WAO35_17450 [Terriglobia bacterium]